MAVKPANSKYHTFTFNGVRAADYGIYVTDVNVFNSAARDVEYIEIPGRDGAFALDRGRFQNISVVYKCAMTQDTDEDFATAISEFRNAIASTKGYKRLEDDIHTDEYRMGVFSKGLEAPTLNTKTATFDIEFNCQPQRFLKSGETAVSISSGGTITNPTPFDAHPLLQVWGYGDIAINSQTIAIDDTVLGNVVIGNGAESNGATIGTSTVDTSVSEVVIDGLRKYANSGDSVTWFSGGRSARLLITIEPKDVTMNIYGAGISSTSGNISIASTNATYSNNSATYVVDFSAYTAQYSTSSQTVTDTGTVVFTITTGGLTNTLTATLTRKWTKNQGKLEISCSISPDLGVDFLEFFNISPKISTQNAVLYSTKSALGEPLYFDLDIGESYKEENGGLVGVNSAVSFPAKLPTLKSGENTITYDDTIMKLEVVPRWWEV